MLFPSDQQQGLQLSSTSATGARLDVGARSDFSDDMFPLAGCAEGSPRRMPFQILIVARTFTICSCCCLLLVVERLPLLQLKEVPLYSFVITLVPGICVFLFSATVAVTAPPRFYWS